VGLPLAVSFLCFQVPLQQPVL